MDRVIKALLDSESLTVASDLLSRAGFVELVPGFHDPLNTIQTAVLDKSGSRESAAYLTEFVSIGAADIALAGSYLDSDPATFRLSFPLQLNEKHVVLAAAKLDTAVVCEDWRYPLVDRRSRPNRGDVDSLAENFMPFSGDVAKFRFLARLVEGREIGLNGIDPNRAFHTVLEIIQSRRRLSTVDAESVALLMCSELPLWKMAIDLVQERLSGIQEFAPRYETQLSSYRGELTRLSETLGTERR